MSVYAFRFKVIEDITRASTRIQASFNRMTAAAGSFGNRINRVPQSIDRLETELKQLRRAQAQSFDTREIRRYGREIEVVEARIRRLRGETARPGFAMGLPSLGGIGGIDAGGAAALGIGALGSSVVSTLADFQRFEAVLTNTLGSNSAAKTALQDITDFAAKTPFQVDALTGAFVKLANRGFVPTMSQMTLMGDLAASTGKDFDQLAEAILDAETGEFERLKEFGIRASKENGKVVLAFKNQQRTVANTPNAIRNALLDIAKTAPGVSGSMAAISGTVGGQLSNLADQWTAFKLQIGQTFAPFLNNVLPRITAGLTKIADWVSKNQDVLLGFAKAVLYLGAVIGIATAAQTIWNVVAAVATVVTGGFSAAVARLSAVFLANPIAWVVGLVAALAAGIIYAWNTFEGFRGFLVGMWEVIKEFGRIFYDYAIAPFLAWGKTIVGIFTFDFGLVKEGIADGLASIEKINSAGGIGERLGTAFTKGWNDGVANQTKIDPLGGLFGAGTPQSAVSTDRANPDSIYEKQGGGGKSPVAPGGGGIGLNDQIGSVSGGGREGVRHVTINIAKQIESLVFQNVKDLNEATSIIRREVENALLTASNDKNYAQ